MADDLGLSGAYALQGLQQVLAQRRAEKIATQLRAQHFQQQQFENELKMRNESRLEDVMKGQQADRAAARDEQDFTRAGQINQATPDQAFMPKNDVGTQLMQKAGYGGFLRSAPAIGAQGADFQGPTPQGSSIEDYQRGREEGYTHTATAQQLAEQAKQKAADQRAQAQQDYQNANLTERRDHDRAMERKPSAGERPYFTVVPEYDKDGRPIGGFRFNSRTGQMEKLPIPEGSAIKPPPGDLGKTEINNEVSTAQLDRLKTMFDKKAGSMVGPLEGTIRSFGQKIPGVPVNKDFSDFEAATSAFRNSVIKAITGAQMSEVEAKRIRQQIPEVTDKPEVWQSKYEQTRMNLQDLQNRLHKSRSAPGNKPSAADLIKKYGGG